MDIFSFIIFSNFRDVGVGKLSIWSYSTQEDPCELTTFANTLLLSNAAISQEMLLLI